MAKVSQETINRALLGDPEAAKECTDNYYVLPCAKCGGSTAIDTSGYKVYCQTASCGTPDATFDHEIEAIEWWNTRPDLRAAAKELYAPKWIACSEMMPPNATDCLICFPIIDAVAGRRYAGIGHRTVWESGQNEDWFVNNYRQLTRPTHWMPIPEAAKESE